MSCVDEEQVVLEQLTLSNFKISKKWEHKNIMTVLILSLLLIFELTQQAALLNFELLLNVLKISKFSF